ncbi:hypothetical protein PR048_000227 [Dryococelus australis]|uniref:long-chain-fatty-acid--CoA ligase n=1 Tax=Dryococelus australis TaxID=614101 RepID=A0ABQ9IE20_9NEOP|nr:hypothetical protein PR048_000227 [Dryococelus australis]
MDQCYFKDDNARCHVSRADDNVCRLDWPTQNPDLNPIEYLWDNLECRGIDTLQKFLHFVVKMYGDKNCLGTRQILSEDDELQPNGRVFKKYTMGDYEWKSFHVFEEEAGSFGRGLRILGQEPFMNIAIFAETRAEWMVAAHGCFKQNIPREVAPKTEDTAIIMYTSGSTGTPKGVLLSHKNIMSTMKAFSDAVDIVDSDVFMGYLPLAHVFELLTECVCLMYGVGIGYSTPLTMMDTSSKIKKGSKGDATVLKPSLLTSVPLILDRITKGVNDRISKSSGLQRELFRFAFEYKRAWTRQGFKTPLINRLVFGKIRQMLGGRIRLVLCGGAPLAQDTHEFIKVCLCVEITPGYGLTETCSGATILDIAARTTKNSRFTEGPSTKKCLEVFSKRIRLTAVPRRAWPCIVRCVGCCSRVWERREMSFCREAGMGVFDMSTGRVGNPTTETDIRLVDWQEGNYTVKDKPYPRGELVIGGDHVSLGYYKLPDKTNEEFFQDAGHQWFKSGDIAELHPDGVFTIIEMVQWWKSLIQAAGMEEPWQSAEVDFLQASGC